MTSETSSSYIFDATNSSEITRLITQGASITDAMGGTLAGIADPSSLHTILDLACGPGGWALDVASELPNADVIGVDIIKPMIDYANAWAHTRQLSNVSFRLMDITQPFDFPDATFDLVNTRLLFAVLHREAWAPFLAECYRITKPSGIIRLTELVGGGSTTCAALQRQFSLLYHFLYKGGYGFSPDGTTVGVSTVQPRILKQLGCQKISHAAHVQDYSQGSPEWANGYLNQEILNRIMLPLFVTGGLITQAEADQLHEETTKGFQADDFCSMLYFHTVQAVKPAIQ